MSTISIIIPTLNEEEHLPGTLKRIYNHDDCEVVIVDGGSSDRTCDIARSKACTVLDSPPGRAIQMNLGAEQSTGNILLFLHGDTRLPTSFDTIVSSTLEKPGVVAGAFSLQLDQTGFRYNLVAKGANVRSSLLQLPYGDQGLFLSRKTFEQIGGIPQMAIMEDYVFVQKLKTLGHIVTVPEAVITSARRWQNLGVVRTTLINQCIIIGYHLGVSPNRLAKWYRRLKGLGRSY